jgi:hypothetical protein
MGYLSEMDGDRETADFYYSKAQDAKKAKVIAAVATRKDVEGKPLRTVAEFGDNMIAARMEAAREERIREAGNSPVLLMDRSGGTVAEPDKAPEPEATDENNNGQPAAEAPRPGAQPNEIILPPLQPAPSTQPAPEPQPKNDQPPVPEPPQPTGPPEPYYPGGQPPMTNPPATRPQPPATNPTPAQPQPSTPPSAQQPTATQPSGSVQIKTGGDVLEPLPDNQQPTAKPPAAQPQIKTGGDVLEPLPDNQQPPAAKQPTTPKPPKN